MKIGVVGSINVDMVFSLPKFLKKGETLIGNNFQSLMGGKGANQAVMISALMGEVAFLGSVGRDSFGSDAIKHLKQKGINTDTISLKKNSTGLAVIQLVNGENSIAVIPGANMEVTREEIDKFLAANPDMRLVVSQLEINFDAILYLIDQCKNKNISVILNPAPAQPLSNELLEKIEFLVPNETETEYLFGTNDYESLVKKYAGKLIITMGSKGVLYFDGQKPVLSPSQHIDVIDTTGAGDSFVAGFAVGISKGFGVKSSVELGIKVASLTCLSMGAQGAFEKVREKFNEEIRHA